ncbi:hypothetical protein MCOR02_009485 [Pyricularia oryzae]|nr:hypothetical protein MCOR02_009485 [Pyricularia oryzae]
MSRDILERAKSSIRLHGRHINNHLEGTPKATQAMSLSKRLARPVATLARWNRPVLHRCLHQPSDPRQSGNQQKADHAPDAQNDPTQGPRVVIRTLRKPPKVAAATRLPYVQMTTRLGHGSVQ